MSQAAVTLYALSTCIHCRHAREYLEKNNIPFDFTYVDKLEGDEQKEVIEKVKAVNPNLSFPTMIIGSKQTVVVGFNPEAIQKALAA